MAKMQAKRYHDFSMGHRVHNHESKCAHLHGHNYRVHFTVEPVSNSNVHNEDGLDLVGRVMDFSVIKEKLCDWLEENWDHKFMAWEKDPFIQKIANLTEAWGSGLNSGDRNPSHDMLANSLVWVPFNPTAENMAQYLVEVVGPMQLAGTGCVLTEVTIEETRKCYCTFTLGK